MQRKAARVVRRWRRLWHRFETRLRVRFGQRATRPTSDRLAPSPGVEAFLAGETMRQVAYYVGNADPGIIDPRDDWPGAVADAHGVVRNYVGRLQSRVAELEQE